jgi:formate hydrogenlyase subunit 3/multisubunit Na+/H+ antiporter MnhD subunit
VHLCCGKIVALQEEAIKALTNIAYGTEEQVGMIVAANGVVTLVSMIQVMLYFIVILI